MISKNNIIKWNNNFIFNYCQNNNILTFNYL